MAATTSSSSILAAAGQHTAEPLVSSCRAASNPYKQSMLRLLDFVGLEHYGTSHATMPPRTADETARIARHVAAVSAAVARHQESVRQRNIRISRRKPPTDMVHVMASAATARSGTTPTIFVSFEESVEWKAFLASTTPEERHAVTVRRRLSVELWRAHQRDMCLWCWFPRHMCMCAELDALRDALPAHVLDRHVEVTMLLHSEELMRSTNTGHIAAYLLGAPLRVWGVGEDDRYLRELAPEEHRPAAKNSTPITVYHTSLYPSSEAVTIHDFIERKELRRAAAADDGDRNTPPPLLPRAGVVEGAAHDTAAAATPQRKVHLVLLDSTWSQALSLNRHIPRDVPRVALEIAETYESLFQALRKRTREACVSTLEATSMAVEQCVRAMGYADEAATTAQTLTDTMKRFVDARCLLKYAEAQFSTNGEALDEFRDRRDEARRKDAARRKDLLATQMLTSATARQLLLPPVLNYCYCCDCVIGWHRVAEHVMGRGHRTALEKNPSCTPSAASRSVLVPDFSRPPRQRPANGASAETEDSGPSTPSSQHTPRDE